MEPGGLRYLIATQWCRAKNNCFNLADRYDKDWAYDEDWG